MNYYVGLDVSLEKSAVCVIDNVGHVVFEYTVASHPDDIGECLAGLAGQVSRLGLEAGPLAPWLYGGLAERSLPAHCIEVRQMKVFARASPVKTDRRDARLIAQAMRTGLFKATHVKTDESRRIRLLLRHRQAMVRRNKDLINTVRGTLKAFGIRTGGGKNSLYAKRVREAINDPHDPGHDGTPPGCLRRRAVRLGNHRQDGDRHCTAGYGVSLVDDSPRVGPVTALTFRTGVDVAHRFAKSRLVAAVFGLTPRVYSSGEMEQLGRITKCADAMARALLYEAANVMLTRCRADNWLKSWALGIARHGGERKAKVDLARRQPVVLHRMWTDGIEFTNHVRR